jgi:acetyl-CoA carboxylase carboxyl transferase subunit beta
VISFLKRVRRALRNQPVSHRAHVDDRAFLEQKHSCPSCQQHVTNRELASTLYVCTHCGYHFRLTAAERIRYTADHGVFHEYFGELETLNPLDVPDYVDKVATDAAKTGLREAVLTGTVSIEGRECVLAVMDANFRMGTLGSVVGEKVTRAILLGARRRLPVVIFTASGGARVQEGMYALMQMAKTSCALLELRKRRIPYIVVQTDPTTAGVQASFATLGDVILAEPGALIGFAGRRVIEGTLRQKLPDNFQLAEFQLARGFVDSIVDRREMRRTLRFLMDAHRVPRGAWPLRQEARR